MTKKQWGILILVALAGLAFLRARHQPLVNPAGASAPASQPADRLMVKLQQRLDAQRAQAGADGINVSTTPGKMRQEYEANEVAADRKFKGKWIQLRGKVGSISTDITGDPYLVYPSDSLGVAQIHAELSGVQIAAVKDGKVVACSALDKAAAMKAGQTATVECLGAGSVLGMPRLEQCIVVDGLSQ